MCEKYSFIVSDTPFQIWWGKGVDSHSVVREMYPASRGGAEVEWTGDLEQDLVVRHIDPKMARMLKGLILDRYPTRADLLPLFSGWVEYEGNKFHYRNGELDGGSEDGPAIIWADGGQSWYKDGKCHRLDGPARIGADGGQFWYKDGKLHREDGPAWIGADGGQQWWVEGHRHRDSGPAWIGADGSQQWFKDGQKHREDGPAYIGADGGQAWFKDGKYHRLDGPAYIGADGHQEWWVEGKELTEKQFNEKYGKND